MGDHNDPSLKCKARLKTLERLSGVEQTQCLNYLKMTGMKVGLLINFGSRVKLEWKRYVM